VRISRRQLIGWGVAVSVPGIAAPFTNPLDTRIPPPPRVALVVVDERFAFARRYALSIAPPAVRRVALPRDALDFWLHELEPLCCTGTQAIAGATTERSLFLLQTLAADHRLRVSSRTTLANLDGDAREPLVSWLLVPRTTRA
jgi:hypothetical protein